MSSLEGIKYVAIVPRNGNKVHAAINGDYLQKIHEKNPMQVVYTVALCKGFGRKNTGWANNGFQINRNPDFSEHEDAPVMSYDHKIYHTVCLKCKEISENV